MQCSERPIRDDTRLNERWVQEDVSLVLRPAGEENRREENVFLSSHSHLRAEELLELLDGAPLEFRWEPVWLKPRAEDRRGVTPETVDMR